MKKVFLSLIATSLVFFTAVFVASEIRREPVAPFKVAMITGYADVDDNSFNQSTFQGCKSWCEENNIPFNYYKPAANSNTERCKSLELAIDRGYKVIFLPGYNYGEVIAQFAPIYPDVTFLGIDVTRNDFPSTYEDCDNVYCFSYYEEVAGYLAGYSATIEGYRNHGFLGGMKALSVTRFGYGYVQGVDAAAQELHENTKIDFAYGGQFYGDNDITKYVDNWYKKDTEIVFACGGSIYTSVALAAKDNQKKMIGVDSDQSPVIERDYGPNLCLTSAMKGIAPTCKDVLTKILNKEPMTEHFVRLGLISSEDLDLNFIGLPTATWTMKNFTIDEYKAVVEDFLQARRHAFDEVENPPEVSSYTHLTIVPGTIK